MNFWTTLKKPLFVLAPMANVTDAAFRQMIAKYGKPHVFWTEFVSVDGLVSEARENLLVDFWYSEEEHPIVAQIFGSKPEHFYKVAKLVKELGFDGVDINMGCPVKKVINQQSCSALIRTPKLAQEIIQATKEGAEEMPVSVKTRIGFNKVEIDTWIPTILETNPAALVVHLRTVKEMSKVPAHWELMPEIVKIANSKQEAINRTLILGNGDITTLAEGEQRVRETGCDGVMIGRGIFGNPWMFNRETQIEKIPIEKRLEAMIEHTKLFEKKFKGIKNFEVMKKHYKAYVNGFDGAKELHMKLMEAETAQEVEEITKEFTDSIKNPSRAPIELSLQ